MMTGRRPMKAAAVLAALLAPGAPGALAQMPGIPGGMQVEETPGTWAHVVRASSIVDSHVADMEIGDADGIDGDFMAAASVHATRTVPGPDLCDPTRRGVSDFRVIAMDLFSRDVPFLSGEQESRLIVDQEVERAVIYLHGDVREWAPGPTYCEDGQMALASSGRGMLRLEYETTNHIVPLNFQAYPRQWEIDQEGLEEACRRFESLLLRAYQEAYPRWQTIPVTGPPGPIDTSIIRPPSVPEGQNNGEDASFEDGTLSNREIGEALGTTSSVMGWAQALAPAFEHAPRIGAAGAGLASWAIQEAVSTYGGESLDNHLGNALQAMKAINSNFAGDARTRPVAEYASRRASFGGETFVGIDADYYTHMALDICANTELDAPVEGFAAGHFSYAGGTVQLVGTGPVKGFPAALANGPVMPSMGGTPMSVADALKLAEALGAEGVPSAEELKTQLPEGYSLDNPPIHMTGQAAAGVNLAPNTHEWAVSYHVEIDPDGERIAALWFDPKR